MKKFNVGLQLYGVRNAMKEDFEGTLRAVREMGYDYVEFAGYFGRSAEEIARLLDEIGLKCISVHQGLDFFDDDPLAAIKYLKTFGVKYNVVPWYDKNMLAGTDGWEKTKKHFSEMAALFCENGMKLGYHNHDFEFEKFEGKTLHDHIFEAIDADKIEPQFDVCWVRYAGHDPAEWIRKYNGRVNIVHLKDFVCKKLASGPVYDLIDANGNNLGAVSKEDNGFEFRPLGDGMQDFAPILKACEECGTETFIVEQDRSYDLPELVAAKRSRDYLKNTFGI